VAAAIVIGGGGVIRSLRGNQTKWARTLPV